MLYILKKLIPNVNLKIGDIVDSTDVKYSILDFTTNTHLELYKSPKYDNDKYVLYKNQLYKTISYHPIDKTYVIKDNTCTLTVKENQLQKARVFYFIDSNGIVQMDYLERKSINIDGIKYKKATGNYFFNKENAVTKRKSIKH